MNCPTCKSILKDESPIQHSEELTAKQKIYLIYNDVDMFNEFCERRIKEINNLLKINHYDIKDLYSQFKKSGMNYIQKFMKIGYMMI